MQKQTLFELFCKMVILHSTSTHKPLYTPNYTRIWQIKCKTLLSCVFCLFSVQWSTQECVTALTRTCICTNTLHTHSWLSLPL